jgi:trimeric autotransporter adhesin
MGSNTAKLQELRPVTFKLKSDAKGTLQYGLIAEEVSKVYPELVVRDEQGRINGVRYDELAPMLLNEVQNQKRVNATQAAKIAYLEQQLSGIQAALVKLQSKDQLAAQR